MTDTVEFTSAEQVEATTRALMAERAQLPDQYPHRKRRFELLCEIHSKLDEWNYLTGRAQA